MTRAWVLVVLCACNAQHELLESAQPLRQLTGSVDAVVQSGVWAKAVVRHAPQLADVAGGLPIVSRIIGRPIAGEPFTIAWTTRPSPPLVDANVVLLASQRKADPAVLDGASGGMLMVHPDLIIAPQASSLFTLQQGVARFDVMFPPAAVGSHWFVQAVVADARVDAGVTFAPVVELTVGDR